MQAIESTHTVADWGKVLWEGVEEANRSMARQYGEVWSVTIPMFAGNQTQWLHNRVAIPVKIAKAVYVPAIGASVYVTDNAPGMAWQAMSVAQFRDMSGIDPFPALSETVKRAAIQLPAPTPHQGHGGQHTDSGWHQQNYATADAAPNWAAAAAAFGVAAR